MNKKESLTMVYLFHILQWLPNFSLILCKPGGKGDKGINISDCCIIVGRPEKKDTGDQGKE